MVSRHHCPCFQEIMTGNAYAKSKGVVLEKYGQAHAFMMPHIEKAWVAVEPTAKKVQKTFNEGMEKARTELSKEPYKKYVDQAGKLTGTAKAQVLKARDRAVELWNSEKVRCTALGFVSVGLSTEP